LIKLQRAPGDHASPGDSPSGGQSQGSVPWAFAPVRRMGA
jgi:hypothetical protein